MVASASRAGMTTDTEGRDRRPEHAARSASADPRRAACAASAAGDPPGAAAERKSRVADGIRQSGVAGCKMAFSIARAAENTRTAARGGPRGAALTAGPAAGILHGRAAIRERFPRCRSGGGAACPTP